MSAVLRMGPPPKGDTDLVLAVLCAITPPGHCWSETDLADMLGYDHERIRQIENGALKKLRTRNTTVQKMLSELDMTYTKCRPTSPRHQQQTIA